MSYRSALSHAPVRCGSLSLGKDTGQHNLPATSQVQVDITDTKRDINMALGLLAS